MNHLFDDSWVTLRLPLLYNPSFSTPWASFAHFNFGEQEERPRVRVYLWFSREERILFKFSRFFHPIEVCEWRKFFQVWKDKTSHTIFKHKTLFHQTSNFFFHQTPWDTFSSWIVKTHFQPNLMKYISESNETCFFMI